MRFSLEGKVAIITGASRGLGFEIARNYLQAGASVVISARNGEQLEKAHEQLAGELTGGNVIESVGADLSDAGSADLIAGFTLERLGRIDLLVNNAGMYGPIGPVETVDRGEWLKTIEVNLFGSVLLCRAVLPAMKARRSGKIIQLSGGGATKPMPNFSAYAASKAAIVRFIDTVAEEVREYGIDVNALAPGAMNTAMLEEVLAAGPEKAGQAGFDNAVRQQESGGAGFDAAAQLALFLASDVSNGISGKLISALWDNWTDWPQHLDELRNSDAYSIRRIVGRDRGFDWGDR